jgi:hypothetical protein
MNKKINIRLKDDLYERIKAREHDFGAIGMSESVRRLILVALHLTEEMEQNEKLRIAMEVLLSQKKESQS